MGAYEAVAKKILLFDESNRVAPAVLAAVTRRFDVVHASSLEGVDGRFDAAVIAPGVRDPCAACVHIRQARGVMTLCPTPFTAWAEIEPRASVAGCIKRQRSPPRSRTGKDAPQRDRVAPARRTRARLSSMSRGRGVARASAPGFHGTRGRRWRAPCRPAPHPSGSPSAPLVRRPARPRTSRRGRGAPDARQAGLRPDSTR